MSKAGKILSITIPTWNRARILPGILDQICEQVVSSKIEDDVELFITNNGSNDNTEEICLNYKSRFKFITYHNNGINIGARDNVLKCFEMASSQYIILFGDDDRITPKCISTIVQILKSNTEVELLFDSSSVKKNSFSDGSRINLKQFVEHFYYYVGNAGLFIYKLDLAKRILLDHSFSFFNKSWPQTQLMILGIKDINKQSCLIKNLQINAPGLHGDVMVYNSYYLYRTTYFDLIESIETIKSEIYHDIYTGAKLYFKSHIFQIFFNILQCGIFIDEKVTKDKTISHIISNQRYFVFKERILMNLIVFSLWLPSFLSKPLGNLSIFILKGKSGLQKKNNFVKSEINKRIRQNNSKTQEIREFSF